MLPDAKTLYELRYELSSHITIVSELVVRCVRRSCALRHGSVHSLLPARRRGQAPAEHGGVQRRDPYIDFHILGHDPKLHMDIRITTPMIQMMGGSH